MATTFDIRTNTKKIMNICYCCNGLKKSRPKKLVKKSNKLISQKSFLNIFHKNQNFTIRKYGKYPKKKFREIDSFHLTSFFGLDLFKFSCPRCSTADTNVKNYS